MTFTVSLPISLGSKSLTETIGNESQRTDAAILLSTPRTAQQGREACLVLNEGLWSPGADHDSILEYLAYQGIVGPFRIAGQQGSECNNIIATGIIGSGACSERLPTLCSNSAPVSDALMVDNSTSFQTTVHDQHSSWTGFRDRFSWRFEVRIIDKSVQY
jgi:hypothetical protein